MVPVPLLQFRKVACPLFCSPLLLVQGNVSQEFSHFEKGGGGFYKPWMLQVNLRSIKWSIPCTHLSYRVRYFVSLAPSVPVSQKKISGADCIAPYGRICPKRDGKIVRWE